MTERQDSGTYLITFTAYGTWLHGDARGSSERQRSPGVTASVEPSESRLAQAKRRLSAASMTFTVDARSSIAKAIESVAEHRSWDLLAMNVRTNHVHTVVKANTSPEQVMNAFKAWSTRRLREDGLVDEGQRVWTRHGSTRYLYTRQAMEDAIRYVVEGQGQDLGGTRGPGELAD